ncbi:hypothetical protein NQ314_002724, partial [Rhamnusium bicolor]
YNSIRSDDATQRPETSAIIDNLALIREIFDAFVAHCKEAYSPEFYFTIDRMLEAFRGRCRFGQYIANKPAKYGIKMYALVDARTSFTCSLEMYAGKQPDGPFQITNDKASVAYRLYKS